MGTKWEANLSFRLSHYCAHSNLVEKTNTKIIIKINISLQTGTSTIKNDTTLLYSELYFSRSPFRYNVGLEFRSQICIFGFLSAAKYLRCCIHSTNITEQLLMAGAVFGSGSRPQNKADPGPATLQLTI